MRGSLDALDVALGLGVPTLTGPLSGGSSQPLNTTPAVATRVNTCQYVFGCFFLLISCSLIEIDC